MEGIDNVIMRNDNENMGKFDTVVFIHRTGLTAPDDKVQGYGSDP